MNCKGFNLFTALVSFLLIMLAVLLIQSMIQTERNAADTIAKIESRSKLEATAEMARADALQVFNYALRKKIEDWLTDPERGGLTLKLQNRTWEEIQNDFAESKFGGTQGSQFARFTASSLEGIFYSPSHFGNYTISLEGSSTLESVLERAIQKSVESRDFFTVIECPNGDPRTCEKGTFYVNLHLEKLTQEEYESLPRLHVIDKSTGEELKEIILPRTTFRIYVPLRFFKAIAEAKAVMHFPLEAKVDSTADRGLFSPQVHNLVEEMALGMCDYGSCVPRTNPLEPMPSGSKLTGSTQFCSGNGNAINYSKGLPTRLECNAPWCADAIVPVSYNANNNDDWRDMKSSLGSVAKARVCSVLKDAKAAGYLDSIANDGFELKGSECVGGGMFLADAIEVNVDARESKFLGPGKNGKEQQQDPGRNLGLYIGSSGKVEYPYIGSVALLGCSDSAGDYHSRCAEVSSVKVTIAFRENDPNYMVQEAKQGEERVYRISVYDNTYVPFTANWEQGAKGADFLYARAPSETSCSMASGRGWYCVAVENAPADLGDLPGSVGCQPG